jgi:predicted DNA-binding transcriptional regulator AlpA
VSDPQRPWIHPRDILSAADVRRLCGITSQDRHTLIRWRANRGFPPPFKSLRQKRGQTFDLWDRREVRQWLKENPPVS